MEEGSYMENEINLKIDDYVDYILKKTFTNLVESRKEKIEELLKITNNERNKIPIHKYTS